MQNDLTRNMEANKKYKKKEKKEKEKNMPKLFKFICHAVNYFETCCTKCNYSCKRITFLLNETN